MLLIGVLVFAVLLLIGAPVWMALAAGGGFITVFYMELPLANIPPHFFSSTDSWILLAVPYFLWLFAIFCVTRTFQPFHRLVFLLLHLTTNQMIEREGQAVWA